MKHGLCMVFVLHSGEKQQLVFTYHFFYKKHGSYGDNFNWLFWPLHHDLSMAFWEISNFSSLLYHLFNDRCISNQKVLECMYNVWSYSDHFDLASPGLCAASLVI